MALNKEGLYCVYLHLKPCGEVFYVGIGSNNKRPYNKHSRNKFWKKLVKKYKDIYEVQVIKTNLNVEEACDIERCLISWFGRRDLGTGCLVNMTDGGEATLGRIMEGWQKELLSKQRKGTMLGEDNPNYGNSWSDGQKEHMSKTMKELYKKGVLVPNLEALNKGRKNKEKNFKENPQLALDMAKRVSDNKSLYDYLKIDIITGEILEEYTTFMNLKEVYPNVGKTVVNSVCNGYKVSYLGYLWRYRSKETGEVIVNELKTHNGYKVYYESNGKKYLKITDAAKDDKLEYSSVRKRFLDVDNTEYKIVPITHPYL